MSALFTLSGLQKPSLFQIGFFSTLLLCFLPLIPGLAGLLLCAFGFIPIIGQYHFSLTGFYQLAEWPGIMQSLLLTLFITLSSTFLATVFAFSILQSCWHGRWWHKLENLLAPILALPHVAFSIGFAFLFTPSGFITRLLNLFCTEQLLINWSLINNQYGLGQILGLTIKEIPFLLFMSIPLLKQLNLRLTLQTAQSLGYSQAQIWQKIIFPQWLPKIRFSLFAVMAYNLSVVDVSLVIGPNQPPTLPVLIWRWLNDADLLTLAKASAGAFLLLVICLFLVYLIRFSEWLIVSKFQNWQISGRYSLPVAGQSAILFTYSISIASIFILLIWSFAQRWPYPTILPSDWSVHFWQQEWSYLWNIMTTSIGLALASASLALLLV
ncbi:MAG: thiamine ABC transporter permease, partial [Psychromonas sp.]|nr:thiamine ABC transporter permease [Psychromonas sp.]